nr:reverse transcriptase domain-containing protein [Tanacetum cinerariifolium]
MSTNEQTPLSQPTSVVRNTLGKEQVPHDSGVPIFDESLRENCDMNYHQILPIIAEKVHQQKERLGPRHAHSMSGSPEPRLGRSKSRRERGPERKTMFKRLEKGVFHRLGSKEKRHTTDECMHLKRQIEEMLKAGKLSHLIKEIKQSGGKDQTKATKRGNLKKGETAGNTDGKIMAEGSQTKNYSNFLSETSNLFSSLGEEDGTEGPVIIETEIEGHFVHRMYMDEGSSLKILYEHCFNRFRLEVRRQMIPTTTPLVTISIQRNNREAMSKENSGKEERKKLSGLLRCILDIFAWKPADMIGVPRHIAEHKLNIREGCLPVRQKKRGQAPERNKAIYEEVEKLRMCVDFKDLNKACPKDGYPLSKIDWKVESLCGYPFKRFLDVYKGYYQIKMAKQDEEKTEFITSQGIFYYSKMSFGLKNAKATYQRLVDKAFQKQIGQNLEVYVDDLVIKSFTEEEVIRDIEETFKTLREINMKLNPKKCTFGMRDGTFQRYKVNPDRLKVCPDKVEAVLSLPSPKCLKDVQKLNRKLASLNRFLSKLAKKSLPFFKTLKNCTKKSDFQWTAKAKTAFNK